MRLGVAQIDTRAGDLAHTVERVVAYARTASERGCELLMFGLTTLGLRYAQAHISIAERLFDPYSVTTGYRCDKAHKICG